MARAANAATLPEPTREQLALAYRHMARPGWPSTLDAALQVHHYRICITQLARRMSRPGWTAQPRPLQLLSAGAPVPPTPAEPPPVARGRMNLLRHDGGLRPEVNATGLGQWTRSRPPQWLDVKKL
ncbi:MAG: hypothetical protein RL375_3363, partial [Pseudomonadota bacterium]